MDIEELKKDLLERISDENLYFGEFLYTIKKEKESDFSSFCQYIKEISEKYGVETEIRAFPFFLWWCGISDSEATAPSSDSDCVLWIRVERKGV